MKGISIFLSAVFLLSACVPEKTKVDELMSQMTLEEMATRISKGINQLTYDNNS